MRIIPEWRRAWRMFSVQALAVIAGLPLLWTQIPQEYKDAIPDEWKPHILTGIAVAGLIGRLVKQGEG